jgi:hypothetical protein
MSLGGRSLGNYAVHDREVVNAVAPRDRIDDPPAANEDGAMCAELHQGPSTRVVIGADPGPSATLLSCPSAVEKPETISSAGYDLILGVHLHGKEIVLTAFHVPASLTEPFAGPIAQRSVFALWAKQSSGGR